MDYRKKVERLLRKRIRDNGGTLTIDKTDRTLRDTWNALERMAEDGQLEVINENIQAITYRLKPQEHE